jgi:uncharacterized membrane protein
MKKLLPNWLLLSILSTAMMGMWGALIEIPEKRISPSFPTTLGYVVWAMTMIPCALYAMKRINWKLDYSKKSMFFGALVGLLGAGGQFVCFMALKLGPAYIIFPIISMSPVITILMSILFLKERTHAIAYIGIAISMVAILLLSLQKSDNGIAQGFTWLFLSVAAFLMWGMQGYLIKKYVASMEAENMFFYMAVTSLLFIPFGIGMTDFSIPIGWKIGFYSAIFIQFLNAAGALLFVYAMRYGKAIIVSPIVNGMTPFIAIVLSLAIYSSIPSIVNLSGMILALASIFLITLGENKTAKI